MVHTDGLFRERFDGKTFWSKVTGRDQGGRGRVPVKSPIRTDDYDGNTSGFLTSRRTPCPTDSYGYGKSDDEGWGPSFPGRDAWVVIMTVDSE